MQEEQLAAPRREQLLIDMVLHQDVVVAEMQQQQQQQAAEVQLVEAWGVEDWCSYWRSLFAHVVESRAQQPQKGAGSAWHSAWSSLPGRCSSWLLLWLSLSACLITTVGRALHS
ncbi:hypothetical protein OEZ85_011233 [Tetradesmus obliquus]|uniref:Uncharacterized protein n=1 Tax=Tetradesmus obliquus TaxID=3088 RepID=A0ABY8TTK3_TETOB|nr:hypothetical protein OEZ85_011233 [Tetradesmus obliquus]